MKKYFLTLGLCVAAAGAFAQNFADSLRAFPGAEGYGAWVTGGRGGRVVYVTHTGDTACDVGSAEAQAACKQSSVYQGSLRAALSTPGADPITVMFKCGGVIDMKISINSKGNFKTSRSNMTVAGQTALGDGIVIKGYGIGFSGRNVILRHLRFRPGDIYTEGGKEQSCLWFENASDFIIDHCSFSWAVEESMTIYDNQRTTVQYSLVSESLNTSVHDKGNRGYGAQWGGKTATYHHNFLAHHMSRMPRQNGARSDAGGTDNGVCIYDYVNNVHYNWGSDGAFYGGDSRALPTNRVDCNIINNYYIPGPSTTDNKVNQYFVAPSDPEAPGQVGKWWLDGNVMQDNDDKTNNNRSQGIRSNTGNKFSAAEYFPIPTDFAVTTTSAEVARDAVLTGVGATLPKRDAIDARIVEEATTGTYTFKGSISTNTSQNKGIIDTQNDTKPVGAIGWDAWGSYYAEVDSSHAPLDSDGDGLPDWWEDAEGLNKSSAADGNARGADKYTHLERYLNGESSFSLRPNGEGKFDQHLRWPQVLPDNLNAAATRLGATSTSGLPVTFRSADPGIVTVTDGNLLTVVGAGSTTLTAEVAATAEYSAAAITRTITIKENQVITWAQTLTGTFGDTLTLTAISSNDDLPLVYTPSRADVAKVIDGNRLVLQRVTTTDSVTVRQAGNAYYFDALPVSQRLTVGKAQQTITWEQDTALGYGSDIALTATASSGLTVVYTVSAAGNTSSSTVRNGKLTPTTLGAVTITARQTGGTNHEAATAVVKTFTIGKGAQALAWEQPLSLKVGETLPLTASSDRDLPVSYTSDNLSVATISGNVLTAVGEGEATVRATQAGSDVYAAAEEVVRSITVTAAGTGDGGEQPTGVGSTRQVPVQVYPNPVDDVLTLRFEEEGSYALALSDMSGRVVYQAKVSGSTHTVNVSSYASGTYLLSIENAQKQRTVVKVVVR
jgi:pectate lyase